MVGAVCPTPAPPATFASLGGIDARILRALKRVGVAEPTQVQKDTIPKAMAGHDVLVKARTGSGKTIAYIVPILQKVIAAQLVRHAPPR